MIFHKCGQNTHHNDAHLNWFFLVLIRSNYRFNWLKVFLVSQESFYLEKKEIKSTYVVQRLEQTIAVKRTSGQVKLYSTAGSLLYMSTNGVKQWSIQRLQSARLQVKRS